MAKWKVILSLRKSNVVVYGENIIEAKNRALEICALHNNRMSKKETELGWNMGILSIKPEKGEKTLIKEK